MNHVIDLFFGRCQFIVQLERHVSAEKKYNLAGISIRNNYKYNIYLTNLYIITICIYI